MLVLAGLSGCKDVTTEGFTRITYFPTLEVLGDPVMIIAKGTTFVDPGVYAELKGEDVTDQVETTSNVDTNTPGIYSITYKITNSDGFSRSGSRTVYVADPTPSIISSGSYNVLAGTNRVNKNTGATTNYSGYSITIIQTAPGVFYVTDFLGGYYDKRAGYGSNYTMTGYFKLNSDNTLSLISSHVSAWGDSLDDMYNASVDPATGKISWSALYVGYLEFNVVLNK